VHGFPLSEGRTGRARKNNWRRHWGRRPASPLLRPWIRDGRRADGPGPVDRLDSLVKRIGKRHRPATSGPDRRGTCSHFGLEGIRLSDYSDRASKGLTNQPVKTRRGPPARRVTVPLPRRDPAKIRIGSVCTTTVQGKPRTATRELRGNGLIGVPRERVKPLWR